MTSATPLVFRPSASQRATAALLFVGSLLVGVRVLVLLVQSLPRFLWCIRAAEAAKQPTFDLWFFLAASIGACLAGAVFLVLTLLGLLLIEGCHVLVDDLGIMVTFDALPGPLARKIGSGRLTWKQVQNIEKQRFFFVITGEQALPAQTLRLKFLMVDQLEHLLNIIFERSPNLRQ